MEACSDEMAMEGAKDAPVQRFRNKSQIEDMQVDDTPNLSPWHWAIQQLLKVFVDHLKPELVSNRQHSTDADDEVLIKIQERHGLQLLPSCCLGLHAGCVMDPLPL